MPWKLSSSFLSCGTLIPLIALSFISSILRPYGVSTYLKNLHSFVLNCIFSRLNLRLLLLAVSSKLRTVTLWLISSSPFASSLSEIPVTPVHLSLGKCLSWLREQELVPAIYRFPMVYWILLVMNFPYLLGPSSSLTWHPSCVKPLDPWSSALMLSIVLV